MIVLFFISACGIRNYILLNETITLQPVSKTENRIQYQNDVLCVYFISSSLDSDNILLRIEEFNLELNFDFLIIGYGDDPSDSSTELVKLTGHPKLRTMLVEDAVWLAFVTDPSGVESGYKINIKIISDESIRCMSQRHCNIVVCAVAML